MKTTAILALAAAMPAMAGTPAPVVTVPAPAPIAAPAASCCALEIAAAYNFASRDLYGGAFNSGSKSIDTYGVDLTAVHSFTPNHAVTLRMGYTYGSEVERPLGLRLRQQVETFSIMPGYRYTMPVSDTVSVFVGANVGAARLRLSDSMAINANGWSVKDDDSAWGFAYSAELGISKKLCDTVSVFAAYQFSGNTAKPAFWGGYVDIHQQTYHGVRAGVSIKF